MEKEEGCLSFPEIYAPVKRSEKLVLSAFDLKGEEINYDLDGFFARGVQHENDHLDGVLFTDRLSPSGLLSVKQALLDLDWSSRAIGTKASSHPINRSPSGWPTSSSFAPGSCHPGIYVSWGKRARKF